MSSEHGKSELTVAGWKCDNKQQPMSKRKLLACVASLVAVACRVWASLTIQECFMVSDNIWMLD